MSPEREERFVEAIERIAAVLEKTTDFDPFVERMPRAPEYVYVVRPPSRVEEE